MCILRAWRSRKSDFVLQYNGKYEIGLKGKDEQREYDVQRKCYGIFERGKLGK